MVGAFCARLGWTDLEALVTKFQQRVFFGVRPEVRVRDCLFAQASHGRCVAALWFGFYAATVLLLLLPPYRCCRNRHKPTNHNTQHQVLALTEITGVKGARARMLYKAGLRTPEAVAATDVDRCAHLAYIHAMSGKRS